MNKKEIFSRLNREANKFFPKTTDELYDIVVDAVTHTSRKDFSEYTTPEDAYEVYIFGLRLSLAPPVSRYLFKQGEILDAIKVWLLEVISYKYSMHVMRLVDGDINDLSIAWLNLERDNRDKEAAKLTHSLPYNPMDAKFTLANYYKQLSLQLNRELSPSKVKKHILDKMDGLVERLQAQGAVEIRTAQEHPAHTAFCD